MMVHVFMYSISNDFFNFRPGITPGFWTENNAGGEKQSLGNNNMCFTKSEKLFQESIHDQHHEALATSKKNHSFHGGPSKHRTCKDTKTQHFRISCRNWEGS